MPLPGYVAFLMSAELFEDLFPKRAKVMEGDEKEMVHIERALQAACAYGEHKAIAHAVEPETEPECQCVRIDVDLDDARDCPVHGPHGDLARAQKQQDAADEFAYWKAFRGEI